VAASLAPMAAHVTLRTSDAPEHEAAVGRALTALRTTEAHAVARTVAEGAAADAVAALLLVFAHRHALAPSRLADALARLDAEAMATPVLAVELELLGAQSEALRTMARAGDAP